MMLDLINPARSKFTYKRFTFPDGQDHIEIEPTHYPDHVTIRTRLTNASDLFVLLQATEILRNSLLVTRINLEITYLLAARMDRRMIEGQPITLKVVANVLNSQNYETVRIFDPHSPVALTLIERSYEDTDYDFVDWVLDEIDIPLRELKLIAPDAGATKKTTALGEEFGLDVIYASKVRSVVDGKLSQTAVNSGSLAGAPCLVVDDLCDGGRTFINLAEALKEKGAGKLYLAVSHGIFSKGISPLALAGYEMVFTTNSFKEQTPHTNLLTYTL